MCPLKSSGRAALIRGLFFRVPFNSLLPWKYERCLPKPSFAQSSVMVGLAWRARGIRSGGKGGAIARCADGNQGTDGAAMSRFWVCAGQLLFVALLAVGLSGCGYATFSSPQYEAVRGLFPKEEGVDLDSLSLEPGMGWGKPARAARGGGRGLYLHPPKRGCGELRWVEHHPGRRPSGARGADAAL